MLKQDEQIGKKNGMWNTSEISSYYGKYAEEYDNEIDTEINGAYPGPHIIGNWVIKWFEDILQSDKIVRVKVLDLGCGTGQSGIPFSTYKNKIRFELVGIDATPEMLKQAETKGYKSLLSHDLESYPYPTIEDDFDAIICVGVMDFINNPIKFIRNAKALCERSNTSSPVIGMTLPETHPHSELSSFSIEEMHLMFEQCGVSVVRKQRFTGYIDSKSGLEQLYYGWLLSFTL